MGHQVMEMEEQELPYKIGIRLMVDMHVHYYFKVVQQQGTTRVFQQQDFTMLLTNPTM